MGVMHNAMGCVEHNLFLFSIANVGMELEGGMDNTPPL